MQKRPNAVKFKDNPVTLVGPQLKAGDKAPDFACLSGLDIVKLSQSPGGTPYSDTNSPPPIVAHIHLNGDGLVYAADSAGNVGVGVICKIPPKPKLD